MNGQQETPKMEANTPVMIVLPLIAWTNILGILVKSPWEQVNGIVTTIQSQLQNAAQRQSQPPPGPGMNAQKAMIERD